MTSENVRGTSRAGLLISSFFCLKFGKIESSTGTTRWPRDRVRNSNTRDVAEMETDSITGSSARNCACGIIF
jgi:predicted nucleotidyltransferase